MLSIFKRKPKPEPEPKRVEPTVAKPKAKPKPRKRAPRRNFQELYPDNAPIRVVTEGLINPKRPGTQAHATYEVFRRGTTVRGALDLGVTYRQIDYDVTHGHIEVVK